MVSGIKDFFGAKYESTPKNRLRANADYLPLFAGGAPGMNAVVELDLDAGWTCIVLSNYDPPAAQRAAKRICGWLAGLPR